jgi:predicted O-methyltransferase YrrM
MTRAAAVQRRPLASPAEGSAGPLLLRLPIIERMAAVDGWLSEEEADLLIAGLQRALCETQEANAVVELGCYRGRGTVVLGSVVQAVRPSARVYAIDPHDSLVGALDSHMRRMPPTFPPFERTIAEAGLGNVVVAVQQHPHEVEWAEPIAFLLIDGLHDYASVSGDFFHFEPWLREGACVAFHDYADYFPGVMAFVDELLAAGRYERVRLAGSLIVARRSATASPPLPASPS